MDREETIESEFLRKLQDLKYEYRADTRGGCSPNAEELLNKRCAHYGSALAEIPEYGEETTPASPISYC